MSDERKPSRWGRIGQVLVSVSIVLVIFGFFFPKLADYGEVWDTIRAMSGLETFTLVLVACWNLASYWPLLIVTLPGLHVREAAVSNLTSTAVANTLPGGGALGVGVTVTMQHSWGFPIADVARAGVVAGIWNNFVKLGLPVVALALVAVTGDANAGLVVAATIGVLVLAASIVIFGLLLRSDRLARMIGSLCERAVSFMLRPLRRGPVQGWDDGASRFRADTIGLLEGRKMLITGATVISHISLFVVLLVALRHVGISEDEVGWVEVLAAFSFVRLLSAVPVTPGGLGVVELGLTAALGSGLDSVSKNQVAAAVLLFRALTWFAPIPLGVITGLFWRANVSWRHTVEERRQMMQDEGAVAPAASSQEAASSREAASP